MNKGRTVRSGVRPMTAADLAQVLEWRNHPEIRRHMFTQHEITGEEHRRWFEKCAADPRKHLLIFQRNVTPQGFVSFSQRADGGTADWGFYVAPDAPKGTGGELGKSALRYAFERLSVQKVCGEALAENEPSIRFHLRMGFRQEGVVRARHFDGERHHDVVCFCLLRDEWAANS